MPRLAALTSGISSPAGRQRPLPALLPLPATCCRRARCWHQQPRALLPSSAELLLAALSTLPGDTGLETFEPQLPGPAVAVAAAAAATPPILFWARIFLSAQRRQQAIDAEKAAEQERQRQREVGGHEARSAEAVGRWLRAVRYCGSLAIQSITCCVLPPHHCRSSSAKSRARRAAVAAAATAAAEAADEGCRHPSLDRPIL